MNQQKQNNSGVGNYTNTSRVGKVTESIESRVEKLESLVAKLLVKVNVSDEAVKPPEKKNNNPDYLPIGGEPRSIEDLPKKY